MTVRCTPANPHLNRASPPATTSSAADAGGDDAFVSPSSPRSDGNHANMAHLEALDGWRGRYDPFRSCEGLGRKKEARLPGKGKGKPSPKRPAASSYSATATKSGRGKAAAERRILDAHLTDAGDPGERRDAGGALFGASPFASEFSHAGRADPSSSGAVPAMPNARIVGLATCSSRPSASASASAATPSSSTLYVAAITDTPDTVGVVVHANPHLMLSALSPSASPSDASTSHGTAAHAHSACYTPAAGAFDAAAHGRPRCVSLLPGVVCVGTDAGRVVVYVFNEQVGGGGGGGAGGGRLVPVAEIPAPRGNGDAADGGAGSRDPAWHEYAVSSLELVPPVAATTASGADGGRGDRGRLHRLFVSYRRRGPSSAAGAGPASAARVPPPGAAADAAALPAPAPSAGPSGGVCCYDLGGLRIPGGRPLATGPSTSAAKAPVISARYDMDGRDVGTSCLCDGVALPPAPPSAWLSSADAAPPEEGAAAGVAPGGGAALEKMLPRYAVARGDGLHLYSPEEKVGVCPVDGSKVAVCALPPPPMVYLRRPVRRPSPPGETEDARRDDPAHAAAAAPGPVYALVATADAKSGRDAVDIYDTTNKLVGYHVLLSPGHRALRAAGAFSPPTVGDGTGEGGMSSSSTSTSALLRGGRSTAVVFTSGGSIVTLTEKATPDKVCAMSAEY